MRVCGGYDEEGRDMKLKGKEKSEPETEKDKERQKLKKEEMSCLWMGRKSGRRDRWSSAEASCPCVFTQFCIRSHHHHRTAYITALHSRR